MYSANIPYWVDRTDVFFCSVHLTGAAIIIESRCNIDSPISFPGEGNHAEGGTICNILYQIGHFFTINAFD